LFVLHNHITMHGSKHTKYAIPVAYSWLVRTRVK